MMDRAEQERLCRRFLVMAERELGVHEAPGKADTERVLDYLRTVAKPSWLARGLLHDSTAWCAAFVQFCLAQAEWPGTGKANARSYLSWGQATTTPVPGCVVVFSRPPLPGSGHVGFYVREDATHVYVLGGNQGNRVSIAPYPKSRLLGYRLPQTPPKPAVA